MLPLLVADKEGVLEATTLLKALEEKEPDRFNAAQLRTLQRRVSQWRALHGPKREVYFEQVHVPGREGAFDFTNCNELRVTIQGVLFLHLLFEFVLSFSKWRHVSLAFSETFEAMVAGLQRAVWSLGGVPAEWRSDNLSAATHQLPGGGRELTRRYKAVLEHYGGCRNSCRLSVGIVDVDQVDNFVRWYNQEHRHSAINWITPLDRHTGKERELLRRREETYRKAKRRHPERWSRDIRDCAPAPAVTLNPTKKRNEIEQAA